MTDTDPDADAKQKTERARAEAARDTSEAEHLRAKAELIKAQRELATASKTPDGVVVASVEEKARLDAQKDALDSKRTFWETKKSADLSAAQAAVGTVSGSGVAGSTDVKTDAGKGEAVLLAARALQTAAASVAEAIKNAVKNKRVVLMQSTAVPDFANYRQFLLGQALMDRGFRAAEREAEQLSEEADRLGGLRAPAATEAAAVPLAVTAGVVLDAVTKLGSYFLSNYEIGGVGLTPDAEQLVSAIANRLLAQQVVLVLPARRVPQAGEFSATVAGIERSIAEAGDKAAELGTKGDVSKKQSESEQDRAKKEKLENAAKLYEQAAVVLRKAIGKAEEFIAALGVADAKGVALITKIAQEKALHDELKRENAMALVLDVRAMAGGYYTKKNLWTLFGSMPFYAMGGAVVTYCLINANGEVAAAGLVPVHSGYAAVHDVQAIVNGIS
jgi:hypothetical protein